MCRFANNDLFIWPLPPPTRRQEPRTDHASVHAERGHIFVGFCFFRPSCRLKKNERATGTLKKLPGAVGERERGADSGHTFARIRMRAALKPSLAGSVRPSIQFYVWDVSAAGSKHLAVIPLWGSQTAGLCGVGWRGMPWRRARQSASDKWRTEMAYLASNVYIFYTLFGQI